jgi:hypothetical protein
MGQLHLPQAPVTGSPSIALCTAAAGHKYWMPSYAVQEAVAGGALAMVGGGSGPVAISTSVFMISLQDCIDVGATPTGLVAPLGVGFQQPSTRWVGFSGADFFAGVIGMAGDALSAAVGGRIGGQLGEGLGNFGSAVVGAVFGIGNNVVQGLLSRGTDGDGGSRFVVGMMAAGSLLCAPAGIGILSGQAADAVGGPPRPHDSGPSEGVSYADSSGSGSSGGGGSSSSGGGGSGGGES